MKRPLALLLGLSMLLCTGCAVAKAERETPHITDSQPDHFPSFPQGYYDADYAAQLFQSTLETDENGQFIYPDSYGGMYIDVDRLVFQVAAEDFSEYSYLTDEYDCVKFVQVEYSWNYLTKLRDEYYDTYDKDVDTVYSGYVDVYLNRAVIEVDAETLSRKSFDENSPLIFKEGSPIILLW